MHADMLVTMGHSCLGSTRLANIQTMYADMSVYIGSMHIDLGTMVTDTSVNHPSPNSQSGIYITVITQLKKTLSE